jgi:hypothetical protein
MLRNLEVSESSLFDDLTTPAAIRDYSCTANLLVPLRASPAHPSSDQLLGECLKIRTLRPVFIETLLTLAFIPMLHGTIRRVLLFQPALAEEDVTQQALSLLLQFLQSDYIRTRQTHFAFAISRALKRQLFTWAQREGMKDAPLNRDADLLASLVVEDSFEPHAQLRHFLHRCVKKGDLTDAELDLLIQYKLEANRQDNFENSNGHSSNALRQRLKRLLGKLRRLAR